MNNCLSEDEIKVAFYVSNNATRLQRAIEVMIGRHANLLNMIAFVFVDNVTNLELKRICKSTKILLIEEDLSCVAKHQRGSKVSDAILCSLKAHNATYLICFGDKILSGDILAEYENRMINFHPSLLPAFKGMSAIDKALEARAFLLGNSAHIIDKDVDNGPVIMQSLLHVSEYKSYDDVLDLQIAMLIQLMAWIKVNRLYFDELSGPYIKDASYAISRYIPNLEIEVNS